MFWEQISLYMTIKTWFEPGVMYALADLTALRSSNISPSLVTVSRPHSPHKACNPPCADVRFHTPLRARANATKWNTISAVTVMKNVSHWCYSEPSPPAKPVHRWLLLVCSRTHHITVDFISQNGNTVSGGHWEKHTSLHCYSETNVYVIVQMFPLDINWIFALFPIKAEWDRIAANLWWSSAGVPYWRQSHMGWMDW